MKIIKEVQSTKVVTEKETSGVLCDRCGKDFYLRQYELDGTNFEMHFGYSSRFDDEWWSFDCCDDCAEWLKGEFKTGNIA